MATTSVIHSKSTRGAILLALEKHKTSTEDRDDEIAPKTKAFLTSAKKAFHRLRNKGDLPSEFQEDVDEQDIADMQRQVTLDQAMANLVANGQNICILLHFLANITMAELYCDINSTKEDGDTSYKLIGRARSLADRVCPKNTFDPEKESALDYIINYGMLSLCLSDTSGDSVMVFNDMKRWVSNANNSKKRDEILWPKYEAAQGGAMENDYCSQRGQKYIDRRQRVTTTGFNCFMRFIIEKLLPREVFPNGSYLRSLFCVSPSDIKKEFNFQNPDLSFFEKEYDMDNELVKNILKTVKKHSLKITKKTTILIESREQINENLRGLLEY